MEYEAPNHQINYNKNKNASPNAVKIEERSYTAIDSHHVKSMLDRLQCSGEFVVVVHITEHITAVNSNLKFGT